jgi:hypothetical protein
MSTACRTNGDERSVYQILIGKSDGKRSLGRPRRRCVNNGEVDLAGIRWVGTGQGPAEGLCEHSNEPAGCIRCRGVLA